MANEKRLIIVESPTKAKTLARFLGKGYIVESSVGHVRDLPANASEVPEKFKKEPWARLGVNVDDKFKPLYIIQPDKKKTIAELKKRLKEVDELLLATDEDREGEAISWHLLEVLKPKVPVRRMVFHEITKQAILHSLEHTRDINMDLVGAQETRRIIDRLYGYEVSPILWRKIAPKLSAGRVQSVAIRMVVDRERERMRFRAAEYWDLTAEFRTDAGKTFPARLVSLGDQRLATGKDFDANTGKLKKDTVRQLDAGGAQLMAAALSEGSFQIISAEEKPFTRSPAPPFTTSTLQQEGNRKLRFDAKRTMRAAQKLYETGHITYMRTDSVALSGEAIRLTRTAVEERYGPDYLPPEARAYKTKVKNAQEAHEAIRPAGDRVSSVEEVQRELGGDPAKVYELIWKRTLACQMKNAQGRRMVLKVRSDQTPDRAEGDLEAIFQANGNVIDFAGFLRAYVEGTDDPDAALSDKETVLPPVQEGDAVQPADILPEEHRTTPPARLTEATLVKMLEESGIGRPSTYASIIDTIERREYTFKKGSALVPTFTAFAVVTLMREHLTDLIDPSFTAKMEDRLDEISRGEFETGRYLEEFYRGNGSPGLRPLLDQKAEDIDPRRVCTIEIGKDDQGRDIVVRVGRYGPFVQREDVTAPIPDGTCPDEMTVERAAELIAAGERAGMPIGQHPETNEPVYVKTGRFGPYVQLGDPDPDKKVKTKPKMVSLLRGMTPDTMTLEVALQLLSLPRTLGQDADGVDVQAFTGRYGPYIKRGTDTRSLGPNDHLLTVDLARAMELLAEEKRRGRQAAEPIKVFEKVKALGGVDVRLLKGRYGPYITDGEVNASLPSSVDDPAAFTLAEVIDLIERKRAAPGRKKKAKKKAAKKKTAKKKTAKKATKKVANNTAG